jgi:hypothetical protein
MMLMDVEAVLDALSALTSVGSSIPVVHEASNVTAVNPRTIQREGFARISHS